MRRITTVLVWTALWSTAVAQDEFRPLPRDVEFELALSALPRHLRDDATVYTLDANEGFVVTRLGTNGFHAFVARQSDTLYRGTWELTEYRDDIIVPIAFDAAGAESIMPVHFDIARMQASGTPPGALKRAIKLKYERGDYRAPDRPGVSYMLAPVMRAYANPDESAQLVTTNLPHYMFYAPGISNEDIAGLPGEHPFVINTGPHGFIIAPVGRAEREAINTEYSELIERLCEHESVFCIERQNFSR